ncbi:hypothetical protein O6H91_21G017100 [Diphasiastrum complanatum]|nr:hypothetical protein O6H91_21G017100 [Diphasiastrum complanatum]
MMGQPHSSCINSLPFRIVVVEGGSSRRKLGLCGGRSLGHCSANSSYFPSLNLKANNNSSVKELSIITAADVLSLEGLCERGRETSGRQENNNSSRDDGKVGGSSKTVSFSTFRRASLRKQSFTIVEKLEDSDSATGILDTTPATARERSSGGDMPPVVFLTMEENQELPHDELKSHSNTVYAKLDSSGRLRTPRAARELTLSILYAALASKLPPMGIFEDRMRRREAFSKAYTTDIMEEYNLSPTDGGPVFVQDKGNATKLEAVQEEEAIIEAAVLTAPLPLVYNRFVLRMARRIIKATSERWLLQEPILKQLIPIKWKVQWHVLATTNRCSLNKSRVNMLILIS